MPWTRPSLDTLIDQSLSDIDGGVPGADSRLPVSNFTVLGMAAAGLADGLHGHLQLLAEDLDWTNPASALVARRAAMVGLYPRPAKAASGRIRITGLPGATVPADTRWQRSDGAVYVTVTPVTLTGGAAVADITASLAGSAATLISGGRLTLVNPVAGIASTAEVQATGLIAGTEAESVASLHTRFLEYWADTASGTGPYVTLAKQVPGVTRAWEYEHEMGLGTITVRFVMDGKGGTPIPTEAEAALVLDHINAHRPPGPAGVFVVGPVPDPVALTLAISPDSPALRTAISEEINDFLRREGAPGAPTIKSRLSEVISSVPGEFKHRLGLSSDITRVWNRIAVPGPITWEAY